MSCKSKRMYTAGVVGVLALGLLVGGVVIWQMHPGAATGARGNRGRQPGPWEGGAHVALD